MPLIAAYVVYLAIRLLMPGGQLSQAYDTAAPTLAALGLSEAERPQVKIGHRADGPQPLTPEIEGAAVYAGRRHGRAVTVRSRTGARACRSPSAVDAVRGHGPGREPAAGPGNAAGRRRGGRAPARFLPLAGVRARGGSGGVLVDRAKQGGEHWMRDLWLAEHLADAARRA